MPVNPLGPIGVFDSGIGGLTVAKALEDALPDETFIYFGDTAHLPYGDKSPQAIAQYAWHIARFLQTHHCKMLVIACNSASAAALPWLRQALPELPIVDVIQPLVEEVAAWRAFRKIGVIATRATVNSGVYLRQIQALRPDLEVVSLATALLAPLIEEGFFNQSVSRSVIEQYLRYPDFKDIDALLLACTHYPLIRPEIEEFLGPSVAVMDSIAPVLAHTRHLLDGLHLRRPSNLPKPETRFFVSDYTASFEQTARIFYGKNVSLRHCPWQEEGVLIPNLEPL